MSDPLRLATALLDGEVRVPLHSVRAAAWLTRTALEDVVRQLIEAKGFEPGRSTMAARLSCLEVLYERDDPALARSVQYAYSRLSTACHHHAYELAPAHADVRYLLRLVEGFRTVGAMDRASPA